MRRKDPAVPDQDWAGPMQTQTSGGCVSVLTVNHSTWWFTERQRYRLIVLPACSRCAKGKDECCEDMGWQVEYFDGERNDIQCGCGCVSRWVLLNAAVN